MNKYHPRMTSKKWNSYPKHVQILNTAAEFARGKSLLEKNDVENTINCMDRAFELIDNTVRDPKWQKNLKELLRFREELGKFYIEPNYNHFLMLYRVLLQFTPQSALVEI